MVNVCNDRLHKQETLPLLRVKGTMNDNVFIII